MWREALGLLGGGDGTEQALIQKQVVREGLTEKMIMEHVFGGQRRTCLYIGEILDRKMSQFQRQGQSSGCLRTEMVTTRLGLG